MKDEIRSTENLHILLWIFKDTCWVNGWRVVGISMIVPTLAVCWWLCANIVWMVGEFFFDDHTRAAAMVFFGLGPKWIHPFYGEDRE